MPTRVSRAAAGSPVRPATHRTPTITATPARINNRVISALIAAHCPGHGEPRPAGAGMRPAGRREPPRAGVLARLAVPNLRQERPARDLASQPLHQLLRQRPAGHGVLSR